MTEAYKCGDTGWDSEIQSVKDHPQFEDFAMAYTTMVTECGVDSIYWDNETLIDYFAFLDIPEKVVNIFLNRVFPDVSVTIVLDEKWKITGGSEK